MCQIMRNGFSLLVGVLLGVGGALAEPPGSIEWSFQASGPGGAPEGPPLPDFPIQLILDDGSSDGDFGIGDATAQQFLWFNRFDRPTPLNYDLDEIQVLFPPGPNMAVGELIQLAVYLDPDSDPTNGADLLLSWMAPIQAIDGTTFSVYTVDPPLPIQAPGDLLIGVVSRFVESGVTSPTMPAALDTSASQGRSWVAVWNADPPAEPILPPDFFLDTVDVFVAGNWLIRGFGSPRPIVEVPTLSWLGLVLLVTILGLAGSYILRRQRGVA